MKAEPVEEESLLDAGLEAELDAELDELEAELDDGKRVRTQAMISHQR